MVEAHGIPLATILTGANRHDSTQLIPLIDAIPTIGGRVGAPLSKPGCVVADRGYDCAAHRMHLSGRSIRTLIARRGTAHGSEAGYIALAGRTNDQLAASVPQAANSLGANRYDARGVPQARLRDHLLENAASAVLLEALSLAGPLVGRGISVVVVPPSHEDVARKRAG